MLKVSVIGTGNVGTHLCVALSDKVDELVSVNSRTLEDLPLDSDIYILSVSDRAISDVAARMPAVRGIVAHTSGSIPMDVLTPYTDRAGVFYPLQTFHVLLQVRCRLFSCRRAITRSLLSPGSRNSNETEFPPKPSCLYRKPLISTGHKRRIKDII